jgi:hypothetical protein
MNDNELKEFLIGALEQSYTKEADNIVNFLKMISSFDRNMWTGVAKSLEKTKDFGHLAPMVYSFIETNYPNGIGIA